MCLTEYAGNMRLALQALVQWSAHWSISIQLVFQNIAFKPADCGGIQNNLHKSGLSYVLGYLKVCTQRQRKVNIWNQQAPKIMSNKVLDCFFLLKAPIWGGLHLI